MEGLLIALSLMCVLVSGQDVAQLPQYLRDLRCHRSDPKFDTCVIENFKSALPYYIQGIPELEIPPLDPYELDFFTFNHSIADQIKVNGVIKNLVAHGLSNLVLDDYRTDYSKLKAETKLRLPWFNVSLDYDIGGSFFGVPFQSEAHFEGTFTNIRVYLKTSVSLYEKEGVEYFKLDAIRYKLKIGDGHIDIVTEDPKLQDSVTPIVNFFNNNPSGAMEMVQRFMEQYSDENRIKEIVDKQLARFPASEILPD